jgi:hypothetical protein
MDRRDFLKIILASSLAAPLVAKVKTLASSTVLYLISDQPQQFLPPIMAELQGKAWVQEGQFVLLNQHPDGKELKATLAQNRWRYASKTSRANLCLSFELLQRAAAPSFAVVKEGKIWDIRAPGLSRLWEEMNMRGERSACLTVAAFRQRPLVSAPGRALTVYADGKRGPSFSLGKNQRQRITTKNGEVVVDIEGGRARVLASTCRHKICLSSPPAFLAGERIVCAPNKFLLEVEGSRFVDTVTG